jgi:hypothetical protein
VLGVDTLVNFYLAGNLLLITAVFAFIRYKFSSARFINILSLPLIFWYMAAYLYSTIYLYLGFGNFSENIIFQFDDYDLLRKSILLSALSFLSFLAPVLLTSGIRDCHVLHKGLIQLSSLRRVPLTVVAVGYFLVFTKATFVAQGWYGSLASFVEPTDIGIFIRIIPFFMLIPIISIWMTHTLLRYDQFFSLTLLIYVIQFITIVIAGNRREILTLLLPVLVLLVYHQKIRFTTFKILFSVACLALYLLVTSIFSETLGNFRGPDINYVTLLIGSFERFWEFAPDALSFIMNQIFTWINQLHLLGTAIRSEGNEIDMLMPVIDLCSYFIPVCEASFNVEQYIFERSVYVAGDKAYLTNPAPAYLFLVTSYYGLLVYNFILGCIFIATTFLANRIRYVTLFVVSYYYFFTTYPLQSLTGSFVSVFKTFVVFTILFAAYRLFRFSGIRSHLH